MTQITDSETVLRRYVNALQVGAVFSEKPTPREFRQLVERAGGRRVEILEKGNRHPLN